MFCKEVFTVSPATLYRWSGISLIVGGIIGVIGTIQSAIFFPGHDLTPQQVLATPFTIAAILFLVWTLLLVLGMPGFYLRQASTARKLGFAGFLLFWMGMLLGGVAFASTQATMWPYLAQNAPKLLPSGGAGPDTGFLLWILVPTLLFAIGAILLGVGTMRARVFPRWTGVLLIISGVLFLLALPGLPSPIGDIIDLGSNGAFCIAFAYCGYLLMTGGKERVAAPYAAAETQASR
jgi:hypothetical protein